MTKQGKRLLIYTCILIPIFFLLTVKQEMESPGPTIQFRPIAYYIGQWLLPYLFLILIAEVIYRLSRRQNVKPPAPPGS
jgi:hypothetical protein